MDQPRPTYETEASISRERAVAIDVARAWGCDAVKMPKFYKCDSALVRGRVVKAFIEVKCRDVLPDKYPTIILSVDKFTYLVETERATKLPCFFVVRFSDDSIRYVRPSSLESPSIEIGGRIDRGDAQDMEAVAHIPVSSMKVLRTATCHRSQS